MLGNLQVVIIPFVAWAVLGERPGARILAVLPLVFAGIVLISGVLEDGAYGDDPPRGILFGAATGFAYSAFILLLRRGNADTRRPAGPLLDATLTSALAAVAIALAIGQTDLVPSWPAHAWLATLGLTSQVVGWMLISVSLPRLPGGADVADPHHPAGRLGRLRRDPAQRGAVDPPGRRRGVHRRRPHRDRPPAPAGGRAGLARQLDRCPNTWAHSG